jgi:hypothetical protein
MPGAHGGSELDGSPVVQFEVKTRRKKVIAFLHSFYAAKAGSGHLIQGDSQWRGWWGWNA